MVSSSFASRHSRGVTSSHRLSQRNCPKSSFNSFPNRLSLIRESVVNQSVASRSRTTTLRVVAMAGKVTGKISLALEAGKANPAPPVGPALGAKGVNIMQFCKEYNARTSDKTGQIIPVEITVFEDRTFTFVIKTPPASFLLKEAAGIKKGAGNPDKDTVGEVTREQIKTIAETKLPDLNCSKIESAMRTIEGTAKNMGIRIVD
eukprot:g4517.t1